MALDFDQIQMKMAELEQSLENDLPNYQMLLATIHKEIAEQPEIVYKLNDEQIATIITGLGKIHKVEITDVKDKKPITRKMGTKLSEDDV